MTVINVTKAMKERALNPSPCDCCCTGWGNISQWVDKETGDLMEESKSCWDDCEELAQWFKQKTGGTPR